jgi:hypothetical protein
MYRNFAVTTCALGLVGMITGCVEMDVSFNSTNPNAVTSPGIKINRTPESSGEIIPLPQRSPVKETLNNPTKSSLLLSNRVEPASQTKFSGQLRMSNRTNEPVRLAFLARQPATKNSSRPKTDDIPAHWDFAPQEGSGKGLILSLPQGTLRIEKGDVLVAFAQDGSRRYWGPYIVGETSSPTWNGENQEWRLVLTP